MRAAYAPVHHEVWFDPGGLPQGVWGGHAGEYKHSIKLMIGCIPITCLCCGNLLILPRGMLFGLITCYCIRGVAGSDCIRGVAGSDCIGRSHWVGLY